MSTTSDIATQESMQTLIDLIIDQYIETKKARPSDLVVPINISTKEYNLVTKDD